MYKTIQLHLLGMQYFPAGVQLKEELYPFVRAFYDHQAIILFSIHGKILGKIP